MKIPKIFTEAQANEIIKSSKRLFRAIGGLTRSNCLTGYYDNKAFRMTKTPKEEFTLPMWFEFYITRKRARKYVELRAKYRGRIEKELEYLVNYKNKVLNI